MNFKAVIFDLFGTLVDVFPADSWRAVQNDIATVLDLDEDDLLVMWRNSRRERNQGIFPTIEANIEHVLRELSKPVDGGKVADAAKIRIDWARECLTPRRDAVETLRYVRAQGLKVGLVSNCTPEIPIIWPDTEFAPLVDVPLFSCSEGLEKPDVRIFQLSCERLASTPDRCLYIADGQGGELAAAASLGMTAVKIPSVYEHDKEPFYDNPEPWQGAQVTRLSEVRALLGG